MQEIEEKKISTRVQFSLFLQIAGRTLRLTGGNTGDKAEQVYTGSLLPGAAPLSLKHFANHILNNLNLPDVPAEFPDIALDALSATITCPPHGSTSTANGNFTFQGSSNLPFLSGLNGQLVLAGGNCAAGFDIGNALNTSQLLTDLFGCAVPTDLQEFLPTFSPQSPTQPIRLYYASSSLNTTLANASVKFLKGLNLDQCSVGILNHDFAINLQVQSPDDFCIGASADLIDLGILQIGSPSSSRTVLPNPALGGPVVQVRKQKKANLSIDLKAQLIFFPGNNSISPIDLSAGYTTITGSQKGFIGTASYDGSILGTSDPKLSIEWSKSGGLQIRDFPFPDSTGIIDFAKEIKTIANASSGNCGEVADFAFKHTVTTRFKLHIKPSTDNGDPCLNIGGAYTVFILGLNICEIDFAPVSATIPRTSIPKNFDDLGRFLSETLSTNAQTLAQGLWNDKTALAKFLGVQALEQASKEVTARLICHLGGNDAAKTGIENALDGLPAPPAGLVSLAAAAAAWSVATATLGLLGQILNCLTGAQKSQRNAAQQKQAEESQKIQSILTINDFGATYVVEADGSLALRATWSALSRDAEQPGTFLTLTLAGAATETLDIKATEYLFTAAITAGQSYTPTLCGHYNYQGHTFDGLPVSATVAVASLSIASPAVTYDPAKNTVTTTWSPTAGFQASDSMLFVSVNYYTVALWDSIARVQVEGMSATVPGDTLIPYHTFSLLPSAKPYFIPAAGNRYQIRLQAVANLPVFNSQVWESRPFPIDAGIGHTLLGWSFAVG